MMAKPLAKVRVLDLTQALAGPFGSMLLGDLGAEIVRVEQPRTQWDPLRVYAALGQVNQIIGIQRNKRSMTLNLKCERGKQVFYELVKKADVVFDNFRAGVPKRLGIDYDTLRQINPRIICCSLTGFGSTGPYRDRPAYDLIIQAMGGGISVTGEPGRAPCRAGIPIGDQGGGIYAALGIVAALFARECTGLGQKVETSLLEAQVSLMGYVAGQYLTGGGVPGPEGSGHRSAIAYRAYKTKDDYITIAAQSKLPELCKVLGIDDLSEDERFSSGVRLLENNNELDAILEPAFLTKSVDKWMELLVEADIPCSPVYTVDKTLSDPQVLERNMVVTIDLPEGGELKVIGNPIKMSETQEDTYTPPPNVGQHTEEILSQLLGYSQEKVSELRQEQVI